MKAFVADVTVWCEKTGVHDFVSRFYDRATERFYSGSGATALEAVGWMFEDYISRALYGQGPSASRDSRTTPGSKFEVARRQVLAGLREVAVAA